MMDSCRVSRSSSPVLGLSVIQEVTEKSDTHRITMNEPDMEVLSIIKKSFRELSNLWNEIGIVGDMKEMRLRTLIECHIDLQNQMIDEETTLLCKLKREVQSLETELAQLSVALSLPPPNYSASDSLLHQEESLKALVQELQRLKEQRLNCFDVLFKKEQELCGVLALPNLKLNFDRDGSAIPSEDLLAEMDTQIKMLQNEKRTRESKYLSLRTDIYELIGKLRVQARNDFESAIHSDRHPDVLSKDLLQKASNFLTELKDMKQKNQDEIKLLKSRLTILWDCFSVEHMERELFLTTYCDYSFHTIEAFVEEVAKYEKEKRANMGGFIIKLRSEIVSFWDKCYVSAEERTHFCAYSDDNFCDELLELHESELRRWRGYYEDNQTIFEKIAKREALWDQMLNFEMKANDPTRYNNRGGNLLQEEKERKRLLKQLPMLENNLRELIEEYESHSMTPFLIRGLPFRDYFDEQWEQHKLDKENAKYQRQKKHEDATTYGGIGGGITPSKRPLQTPNRTPSKQSRLQVASGSKTPLKSLHNMEVTSSKKSPMKRVTSVALQALRASPRSTIKAPLRIPPSQQPSATKSKTPARRSPRFHPYEVVHNPKKNPGDKRHPGDSILNVDYSDFKCDLNRTTRGTYARSTLMDNPVPKVNITEASIASTSSRGSGKGLRILASKRSPRFNNNGSIRSRKSIGQRRSNEVSQLKVSRVRQERMDRSNTFNRTGGKVFNRSGVLKPKLTPARPVDFPFLF